MVVVPYPGDCIPAAQGTGNSPNVGISQDAGNSLKAGNSVDGGIPGLVADS